MNYTSNKPSLRYLEHIEYYKQMHNEGVKLVDGKIKVLEISIQKNCPLVNIELKNL